MGAGKIAEAVTTAATRRPPLWAAVRCSDWFGGQVRRHGLNFSNALPLNL